MTNSPKQFKETLRDKLLELFWRQWRTLGVSAHGRETDHLLDLEALILATAALGAHDRRLLEASGRWLRSFREWVNLARLRRMSAAFTRPDASLKRPLVTKAIWDDVIASASENPGNPGMKPVAAPPLLKKAALMQLYLRGIFGVNARVEILIYLFLETGGNSNQISREIDFDQKNVYRILERWVEAGFIHKESGKKQNIYSQERGRILLPNVQAPFAFWSWSRFFQFYTRLLTVASTAPWSKDAYLLSSFFRDIHPQAASLSRSAGISLPDPDLHTGAALFAPMAQALASLLDRFQ